MHLSKVFIRNIAICAVIFLGSLFGYYYFSIKNAYESTPQLISEIKSKYNQQMAFSDLTAEQEALLLAIEDPAFYRHEGVDLHTPGAGMTTITQGLVKIIYYPDGFKPGIAKIRQTLIAHYALDKIISKEEQFSLFLNISYFGTVDEKPIYGFENASNIYFSKDFSELSQDEFLMLTAMLIGPNNLKPNTEKNQQRLKRIKKYLAGEYAPISVLDVDYNHKKRGSIAEEVLMSFLRLITNAKP